MIKITDVQGLMAIKQRVEDLTDEVENLKQQKLEISRQRTTQVETTNIQSYLSLTGNYTLTNLGYSSVFVDTTTGDITITLPPSPTDGLVFTITNTGGAGNSVIIDRNGKTINGGTDNATLSDFGSITLHYISGGWIITN